MSEIRRNEVDSRVVVVTTGFFVVVVVVVVVVGGRVGRSEESEKYTESNKELINSSQ